MSKCRFATFNVALNRAHSGQLKQELMHTKSLQIKNVAETLQRTRPDVVLLNEFDHDGEGEDREMLTLFQANYLDRSQNGALPIHYPYVYMAATNTGLLNRASYSHVEEPKLPEHGFGFGDFHGQYAFVILSKYPLDIERCRTFQHFLWQQMPNACLPTLANGQSYYNQQVLQHFRLSSKNHVDLPVVIEINNQRHRVHLLAMHPTPPIFEGTEKRNSRRNHDEIRLFADYINSKEVQYIIDDNGERGGVVPNASFVLMGDFNADPNDGDSYRNAINQLLLHPRVNAQVATGSRVPKSLGAQAYSEQSGYQSKGESAAHTHLFPLRLDYVLPSADLTVVGSGVFWPTQYDEQDYLVADTRRCQQTSDHRLVWVDVVL
ncbi:endonuclease/exonuclease/phosphatase family protein [Aliivibrio kagoshimensis]|uniref:endonuclease/exonuclease/phosphatase family protein n=1 Tax=Aliivibrio kagoshimensis TaxID=2910230 RepID=UPI003D0ED249